MPSKLIRTAAAVELERALLNKDGEAVATALAFRITSHRVPLEEDQIRLITEAARSVRKAQPGE